MLKCGVSGTGTGSCKNPVKSIKIKVLPNACWLSARFQLEVSLTPMPGGRGGGGYSHTLHIRVCAAQRGRDFEAPDLERGIHFRGVF